MTDEELIARLRKCGNGMGSFKTNQGDYGLCDDAADRIETLKVALEEMGRTAVKINETLGWEAGRREAAEARAERLEEALLWCSGSADFNEGGIAHKGWLKVCAPLLKGDDHE